MGNRTLVSNIDESVNYIEDIHDGAFESRYVRREDDYFIIYLSSHGGCNRACRFCFLTQTGQTAMTPADLSSLYRQIIQPYQHYATQRPAKKVHYNFMARGEPFDNRHIYHDWYNVYHLLAEFAVYRYQLDFRINVSTIMPPTFHAGVWQHHRDCSDKVRVYYSMYSVDEDFRKRWLPKAGPVDRSLQQLVRLQNEHGVEIALHHAFIEGQNDSVDDVNRYIEAVIKSGLTSKFNLVRYNPFSEQQGREPSEEVIQRNFKMISDALGREDSRIVPRVGFDVAASCGMFVDSL